MHALMPLEPVDYLVIGHLTRDLTPTGPRLGGTAAYAALTARALGLRVGILTACSPDLDLSELHGIPAVVLPSEHTTTFENVSVHGVRRQTIHRQATPLGFDQVPDAWRHARIVHLGPVAGEVPARLDGRLAPGLLGLTPQGWLRAWDAQGHIHPAPWPQAGEALREAGAAVISVEDVGGDEDQIEAMAHATQVLAVTEGPAGARLYWNGDLRRFRAPEVDELDATGAGDIFAAAFFTRLYATRDPWEAARFAVQISARSVTRRGLDGVPTPDEVQRSLMEVF